MTNQRLIIKLESHVPIPQDTRGRKALYPWKAMKVGDSFVIDISRKTGMWASARLAGVKVTIRPEGKNQLRVWRVA